MRPAAHPVRKKAAPPGSEPARGNLRHYQVLARVSRAINSSLDAGQVLDRVLREAVTRMKATTGSIALINPHTQWLEIEAAIGLSAAARQLKLPIGRGVTGWVAKTGQPLRVADVAADPRYVAVRRNVRSELAVPLVVDGKLIGVLNVDSTRRAAFGPRDEELLVALANQAARVVRHSWLYDAVAHSVHRLETLLGIGQSLVSMHDLPEILRQVTRDACRLMNSQVGSLMLLNEARDQLEPCASWGAGPDGLRRLPLSVEDSLIGVVVRYGKPLRLYNLQEYGAYQHTELARPRGLVSLLSVPMEYHGVVIGALNVYTGAPYRFSNQESQTLGGLANLAAIAIENARLHEKIVAVEEQLRRSERLSTLGLLAAEVAHEIRNPLTVMKMLFHSLDLQFPADDPRARDAEVMTGKMDHLNRIVDRLLRFARSTEPALEPVRINDLLQDVLLLVRHRLAQQSIRLKTKFDADLPPALADRSQIEQAALNLILNAADAMPQGGTLTVTTAFHPFSHLLLVFQDTGVGMDAEQQQQLFRPFLTPKDGGTGLGLAIVQKIVEAHHGQIEVRSARRKGTTVTLRLPVAGGSTAPKPRTGKDGS